MRWRSHSSVPFCGAAFSGCACATFRFIVTLVLAVSVYAANATIAIVGGQVLDGTGAPPITDGIVLISGDRIAAVGRAGAVAIPPAARIIHAGGMTVLPGLIDMHVHLSVIGSMEGTRFIRDSLDRQEREVMPASARQYLMNGVTTVRDLGSPLAIVQVRDRIARAEIPGARLFVAGPMLQKRGSPAMLDRSWIVTNPADARDKVRQLAAAGVDWIKVHDQASFSDDELSAITQEAAQAHKPVCGHAYQSDAEVLRALRFHFKTLEHTGIGAAYEYSDETVRAVIGADACIDPTLVVRTMFFETCDSLPGSATPRRANRSRPTYTITWFRRFPITRMCPPPMWTGDGDATSSASSSRSFGAVHASSSARITAWLV